MNLRFYILFSFTLFMLIISGTIRAEGREVPENISLAEHLEWIGKYPGYDFNIIADIDLTSYIRDNCGEKGWIPIFVTNCRINGNGHKITGLWIDNIEGEHVGLFSKVTNAAINDLIVEVDADKEIIGGGCAGILAGGIYGSHISNCHTKGKVTTGSSSGYFGNSSYAGGLIGAVSTYEGNKSSVEGCSSNADVQALCYNREYSLVQAGALIGTNYGDIHNCHSSGSVLAYSDVRAHIYAGGLIGENDKGTITDCYSSADVKAYTDGYNYDGSGASSCSGGLIGESVDGPITNCYATGNITGSQYVAGLVGRTMRSPIELCYSLSTVTGVSTKGTRMVNSFVGGLCGTNNQTTISKSYAKGIITSSEYAGGLVGTHESGSIVQCYADCEVSSEKYAGGLTAYCHDVISQCYTSGITTSTTMRAGGLIGGMYSTSSVQYCYSNVKQGVRNFEYGGLVGQCGDSTKLVKCYFDESLAGTSLSTGNYKSYTDQARSNSEMRTQSTYEGWDFSSVWKMNSNDYPRFRWDPSSPVPVAVNGVSLNQTEIKLKVEETFQLIASVEPGNATNQAVSWTSDKESVATVNEHGLVTAVAKGTAKITVETIDGNYKAISTVTVDKEDDISTLSFLKPFLKQGSNASKLGLPANWENTTDWPEKITGIVWTETSPKQIKEIDWEEKGLTGDLDLSGCEELIIVNCISNNLSSLNVSGCISLKKLDSYFNERLATLNVSKCGKLELLTCYGNNLSELNITDCVSLIWLLCSDNHLSSLDVNNCKSIIQITCYNNKLESLDVTKNPKLSLLVTSSNKLTSLDVSQNKELRHLHCDSNLLDKLDVINCLDLVQLSCDNNFIPLSELPVMKGSNVEKYVYAPQLTTTISASEKDTLDMTIQLKGNKTQFEWYAISENDEIVDLNADGKIDSNDTYPLDLKSEGKFIVPDDFRYYGLRCYISNVDFPDLKGEARITQKVIIESSYAEATSVLLNKNILSLRIGATDTLKATILPENATHKFLDWITDDPEIVTISQEGVVKAISEGETTIRVLTHNNIEATCKVTVLPDDAGEIIATPSEPVGEDGKGSITISLTIPDNTAFEGSLFITLPEGFTLNLDLTALSPALAKLLNLQILSQGKNVWQIIFTKKSLRSEATISYQEVLTVVYEVDDKVAAGVFNVQIANIDLLFEDETSINEEELIVPITVTDRNSVGINHPENQSVTVFLQEQYLFINSPIEERIFVYSFDGQIIKIVDKKIGEVRIPVVDKPYPILLIRGSSGWVKKIINK